jgi:hypothetical protein
MSRPFRARLSAGLSPGRGPGLPSFAPLGLKTDSGGHTIFENALILRPAQDDGFFFEKLLFGRGHPEPVEGSVPPFPTTLHFPHPTPLLVIPSPSQRQSRRWQNVILSKRSAVERKTDQRSRSTSTHSRRSPPHYPAVYDRPIEAPKKGASHLDGPVHFSRISYTPPCSPSAMKTRTKERGQAIFLPPIVSSSVYTPYII